VSPKRKERRSPRKKRPNLPLCRCLLVADIFLDYDLATHNLGSPVSLRRTAHGLAVSLSVDALMTDCTQKFMFPRSFFSFELTSSLRPRPFRQ
jgi:hypothetical protein